MTLNAAENNHGAAILRDPEKNYQSRHLLI
jgi:hypothetical protein